jgi:sporulation protein YlmC with PRC-barrel domain
MDKIDYFIKEDGNFEDTYSLNSILGSLVLSKNGLQVGRIKEVRVLPEKTMIEGVLVKRGFLKNSVYFGKNYFEEITQDALILNIDPVFLLKGLKVLSAEGEHLGRIISIVRKDNTNDIDKLIVKPSFIRKCLIIPASAIKKIGENVFLTNNYHAVKKYFWQKS